MLSLSVLITLICANSHCIYAATTGPAALSTITIALTEAQATLAVIIACCTFMVLVIVLLDLMIFSRDYQRRHNRLLEQMTNLIHARTVLKPNNTTSTTYVTTTPTTACTVAITKPSS